MDNLLNKIIWKGKSVQSDYYKRLNKKDTKEYFLRRKNVFLNKSKYPERYYLTFPEMRKLEKDFDALLNEFKKHL